MLLKLFFAHWSPPKAMNSSRKGHLSPSLCPKDTGQQLILCKCPKVFVELENYFSWIIYIFSLNCLVSTNRDILGSSPGMEKALRRTVQCSWELSEWAGHFLPCSVWFWLCLLTRVATSPPTAPAGSQSPHRRTSEDQVTGSANQASLRIWKQQPELLIISLWKNILKGHWPDSLLTFPEDKTRENVFELYHGGFQLDLGLENTERSDQERRGSTILLPGAIFFFFSNGICTCQEDVLHCRHREKAWYHPS